MAHKWTCQEKWDIPVDLAYGSSVETLPMFIFVWCDHKSKKAPQEDLVLVEIWLLIVVDSEHTNFICGMIGVLNLHSNMPNTNHVEGQVVCIPDGLLKGKSQQGIVLEACHLMISHAGVNKTLGYVWRWFWWPSIAKDVEDFCISCGKCQTSKGSRQKLAGWLHLMPILSKPWKSIGMDFSGPYPEVQGYDYILIVICQMMNMVHLIPT